MARKISFADIAEAVAADAGVEVSDLQDRGRGRTPAVRPARARAVFLARRLRPDLSFVWLGEQLDRRACTVVQIHGRAEVAYSELPDERAAVGRVLALLGLTELPDYEWTACSRKRLEPLDRLIAATEEKLHRLQVRRAQLLRAA